MQNNLLSTLLKWVGVSLAIFIAIWVFLEVVSVKETKSFSSSEGDIFNTPVADKIFGTIALLVNRNRDEQEAIYKEAGDSANEVHVAALDVDTNVGNAAALQGLLNINKGCLFIYDYLVVVQNPYLIWEQNPFIIYNKNSGKHFGIGDTVTVGGSSIQYSALNLDNQVVANEWQSPPVSSCTADKVWLMNNID